MATGKLPFEGKTTGETLELIFTKEPIAPIRWNSKVPADLERIIAKALEKDRTLRYQSAAEMRTDLQRLKRNTMHVSTTDSLPRAPQKMSLWIPVSTIFVVLLIASILYFRRDSKPVNSPTTTKTAIVVLPFTNMSPDKEQEYFSDGLSEELLNVLAKNPKLQVTSRTSAFSFKGTKTDMKTIAEKLKVTHVLEGSVRKSGNQLRITAQLIEVSSDSHLWSQTYDRQMENVFAVQDEIAASVSEALKATLHGDQNLKTKQTRVEAYNAYLQGQYFLERRTRENLEKAVGYFEQALKIDSNYAPAWVGLSRTYRSLQNVSNVPKMLQEKALKTVEKALQLDPNLAEAHAQMAHVQMSYVWDWTAASEACKRGLELEPENPLAMRTAALLAAIMGRLDEAISLGRRAIELDPLQSATYSNLGIHLYYAKRFNEAEAAFRKALELSPQAPAVHSTLGTIYLLQSQHEKAFTEIQMEAEPFWRTQALALYYHAVGKKKEADATLNEFIETFSDDVYFQVAEIYAFRGEKDKAFEWLELAYKNRDGGVTEIKGDPLLQNLQDDPRWPVFLKQLNLPVD